MELLENKLVDFCKNFCAKIRKKCFVYWNIENIFWCNIRAKKL